MVSDGDLGELHAPTDPFHDRNRHGIPERTVSRRVGRRLAAESYVSPSVWKPLKPLAFERRELSSAIVFHDRRYLIRSRSAGAKRRRAFDGLRNAPRSRRIASRKRNYDAARCVARINAE